MLLRRRSHYGRNDGDGSGDGDGRKPNGSHLSVVNEGKMATVDIVLMWINLFSLAQPSSAYRARRIRLRRLSYNVLDQRRPPSSRGSLSRLLSWSSLLVLPPFQDMVRSLRAPRRFWAAPREQGFWEKDVCLLWRNMGKIYPDWEENCYLQHFRMSKDTFWYLCQTFGKHFRKETTQLRRPLVPAKRMAILLHWLAQASSFSELAAMYAIGKSTVAVVVHEGITILRERLVPEVILFPTGQELDRVMIDFEALCGLPCCGGALDGTFMPMKKPSEFGDTYFCYKKFIAIIVLACVDARGIFTYVNAGRPGSVGDSYAYRNSIMHQKIASGEWLAHPTRSIAGVNIKPFLVADSAFPLSASCMKCYDVGQPAYRRSFNYSLIRTRRVVEQAFGRLKGRWKIMDGKCTIKDPVFVRHVAVVCCALHNVCERHQCPFEPGWLPDESVYVDTTPPNLQVTAVIGSAASVREALARHIHRTRPAPQ